MALSEHVSNLHILDELTYLQDIGLNTHENRWEYNRLDWDSHVEMLLHKDCFKRKYCVDLCAHSNLVTILDPYQAHHGSGFVRTCWCNVI